MTEPHPSADSSGLQAGRGAAACLGRSRSQPTPRPGPDPARGLLSLHLQSPGRDRRLQAARLVAARQIARATHPSPGWDNHRAAHLASGACLPSSSWRLQHRRIARAVCEVVPNRGKFRKGDAPTLLPCPVAVPGRVFQVPVQRPVCHRRRGAHGQQRGVQAEPSLLFNPDRASPGKLSHRPALGDRPTGRYKRFL